VRSYYRQYADKCRTAAQHSPTEKQRIALQQMVQVWRDFAAEHERMVQGGETESSEGVKTRALPGWM